MKLIGIFKRKRRKPIPVVVKITPFQEGQEARQRGELLSANPYCIIIDKGEAAYLASILPFEEWIAGHKS